VELTAARATVSEDAQEPAAAREHVDSRVVLVDDVDAATGDRHVEGRMGVVVAVGAAADSPGAHELTVARELLDPAITGVGDVDVPASVHSDALGAEELARVEA